MNTITKEALAGARAQQYEYNSSTRDFSLAASHLTGDWLTHMSRAGVAKSRPVGDEKAHLLVAVTSQHDQAAAGQVRSVMPNTGDDEEAFPWVLVADTSVRVRGWIVCDEISVGDRAWAPTRGWFTVDQVVRESAHIVNVLARGSATPIRTWFRERNHAIEVEPLAGTLVVVDAVPGRTHLEGKVYEVAAYSATLGRVYFNDSHCGSTWASSWTVVSTPDGMPTVGALIRPTGFIPGADADWTTWASRRVAQVLGSRMENGRPILDVKFGEEYDGTSEWSIRGGEYVGHVASPTTPPASIVVTRAGESSASAAGDDIDWKAKYEDLVQALADEAEARGWCSEYEEFCEEHGVIGGTRERDYDFTVDMTREIDEYALDSILRDTLNTSGNEVDVQECVEIKHRTTVQIKSTVDEIDEGGAADKIEAALKEGGYVFDRFDVVGYELA